ncbi:DUF2846 domain-containing protein [Herbaspirillum sp. HC18]|nr:DUF2846 domain-containing protein [Herbaspirillum sp. HC18]
MKIATLHTAALLVTTCVAQNAVLAREPTIPCRHLGRAIQCATVPLENAERDAQAKQFEAPPEGRANVYLVRYYTIEPKVKTRISVNGQPVGEIAPRTYMLLDLPAGPHTLNARTDHDFGIELELKADTTYFVEHQLILLVNTVTGKLKLVDASDGKKKVMQSSRAQSVLH